MKYSERDLIRYYTTKARINTKKDRIQMQLNYCKKNIKATDQPLSLIEDNEIRKYWDNISFAYEVNPEWCQMYTNKTGLYSPKYIPNELHYYFVENKMIDYEYLRAFTDKNYLSLLFGDIKQPEAVLKRIKGLYYTKDFTPISCEDAINVIQENSQYGLVIKPSVNSWGGRNIKFIHNDCINKNDVAELFKLYGNNFIVQKIIKQHTALAAIHKSSVNTMRIITMLLKGEVIVLSACLRMGVDKSEVDNFSQGGVGCGIKENGQLKTIGYDRYGNSVKSHPSGFHFEECTIPNFNRVIDTVKKAALKIPQFGVVSWDIALDDIGDPVLIEINVSQGGIDIHQFNNGPLYGDRTDEIIDYIFKNYCYEDTSIQYNYNVFADHITVKNGSKDLKKIVVEPLHHGLPVTRIGEHAFENGALEKIILPQNVIYIDYCAFHGCTKLKKIVLPDTLKVISRSAFNNCKSLNRITLPQGVETLGVRAFKGIENLVIYLPSSVSKIDSTTFEECINLEIHAKAGTYAERYAKNHNYRFIPASY